MTWSQWEIPPFFTSVFFILGVLTLYWLTYQQMVSYFRNKDISFSRDIQSWYGIIYMLIFVFSMQLTVVGSTNSWEFTNFQLVAVIFCAFFLKINFPVYFMFPVVFIYMIFDGSIFYLESWVYAVIFITFFYVLNRTRTRILKKGIQWTLFFVEVALFGFMLWYLIKLKFSLNWFIFSQEYFYLIIFTGLLYLYLTTLNDNQSLQKQLEFLASEDELTQTRNFAAYKKQIKQLFHDSMTNNLELTMIMFDIDHFKQVNDTYGHLAGDRVLTEVADTVKTVLTSNNEKLHLYRTGGEEFNVILPGYDLKDAADIVHQVFSSVNHMHVKYQNYEIEVSISMGASTLSENDSDSWDFYKRVDKNLYNSKRNGRMMVTIK